jgi:hypothetical protein
MITFQDQFKYGGDAAKASVKSINIAFHVPIFEYSILNSGIGDTTRTTIERNSASTDDNDIIRHISPNIESVIVEQPLNNKRYRVEISESFAVEIDDVSRNISNEYYVRAMREGLIDKMSVTATVQYLLNDAQEIGREEFQFICLPKVTLNDKGEFEVVPFGTANLQPSIFAIN